MAASTQPAEKPHKILAFALLLIVPLLNAGILAEELIVATKVPSETIRGDDIPKARPDGQYPVQLTLQNTSEPTKTLTTEKEGNHNGNDPTTPKKAASEGTKPTEKTTTIPGTPPPIPHRGDGHDNKPKPVQDDVVCVIKETVEGKNAVHLKLKAVSNCEDTQNKIVSVLEDLCGEDCKLEIYQEAGTNEAIVSGKKIEDDVTGMTNKFNNDNIKDKTNVEEATNRWGKNSKLVLVSLLLAGLLLAALLVAGYYLKMHRKTSKGVRLAESFQVDEENQANTLVSVAPLPQEPVDKPTANGESPPENGNNLPPTTNGHSANQTQVADTEM